LDRDPAETLVAPRAAAGCAAGAVRLREYFQASKSHNTRRAYAADWRDFSAWCSAHALSVLPAAAETVALYLSARAEAVKAGTLARRLSTISQAHQMAGFPSPAQSITVRAVMAGIRRSKGTAQQGKRAMLTEDLRELISHTGDDTIGKRDRALLLTGFAGAFRRSEIVAFNTGDVEFTPDGAVLHQRRSKTDQEGAGRRVGIPFGSTPATCPVRALRSWIEAAGSSGPLFRRVTKGGKILAGRLSDKAVARIVKLRAVRAGLDPAQFSGHSLRAGLATAAARAGVSERAIMRHTGHRSLATLRNYIREGSLFLENPAAKVGL
jgi:site-specific recombinase XerD